MFAAISLLAITFAVVSAAGSADQCCLQRVKVTVFASNSFIFST